MFEIIAWQSHLSLLGNLWLRSLVIYNSYRGCSGFLLLNQFWLKLYFSGNLSISSKFSYFYLKSFNAWSIFSSALFFTPDIGYLYQLISLIFKYCLTRGLLNLPVLKKKRSIGFVNLFCYNFVNSCSYVYFLLKFFFTVYFTARILIS